MTPELQPVLRARGPLTEAREARRKGQLLSMAVRAPSLNGEAGRQGGREASVAQECGTWASQRRCRLHTHSAEYMAPPLGGVPSRRKMGRASAGLSSRYNPCF